jgi:hypothetical protein
MDLAPDIGTVGVTSVAGVRWNPLITAVPVRSMLLPARRTWRTAFGEGKAETPRDAGDEPDLLRRGKSLLVCDGNGSVAVERKLEHDPEKWIPVFGKRSCSTNKLERDDDSKKSHHALVGRGRRSKSGWDVTGVLTDQGVVNEQTVGKPVGQRTVIGIESNDRHVSEVYFTSPGGKERLALRLVYSRIK